MIYQMYIKINNNKVNRISIFCYNVLWDRLEVKYNLDVNVDIDDNNDSGLVITD